MQRPQLAEDGISFKSLDRSNKSAHNITVVRRIVWAVLVVLCLGAPLPAAAECWRWTVKTLPGTPEWQSPNVKYFMALEYYDFNIANAWVGENTPVHIRLNEY